MFTGFLRYSVQLMCPALRVTLGIRRLDVAMVCHGKEMTEHDSSISAAAGELFIIFLRALANRKDSKSPTRCQDQIMSTRVYPVLLPVQVGS